MGPPWQEDPDQVKFANFLCLYCLVVKKEVRIAPALRVDVS